MFNVKLSADVFIIFLENFAGFFICRNYDDEKFQRAAAILSRTKSLTAENYNHVKQHFLEYGISDEDLTIVVTCD